MALPARCRKHVEAPVFGKEAFLFVSPAPRHSTLLWIGVWLVWTSSARPDQLITKAIQIKGIVKTSRKGAKTQKFLTAENAQKAQNRTKELEQEVTETRWRALLRQCPKMGKRRSVSLQTLFSLFAPVEQRF